MYKHLGEESFVVEIPRYIVLCKQLKMYNLVVGHLAHACAMCTHRRVATHTNTNLLSKSPQVHNSFTRVKSD